MMQDLMKKLIRRLEKHSFQKLIGACLNEGYGKSVQALPQFGEDVWHRSGYAHISSRYRTEKFDVFYIGQHIPADLFKDPLAVDLRQPELIKILTALRACKVIEEVEYDSEDNTHLGINFMTNSTGSGEQNYLESLARKYEEIACDLGFDSPDVMVGTCDTYVDQKPKETAKSLDGLLTSYQTSIKLVPDEISVQQFSSEKYIEAGVTKGTLSPCGPVFVSHQSSSDAIQEFEALLTRNPK